jgi:hypothetical protein
MWIGPDAVDQRVVMDGLREPLDFFLHFIDLIKVAKLKEQINLYSRKKEELNCRFGESQI